MTRRVLALLAFMTALAGCQGSSQSAAPSVAPAASSKDTQSELRNLYTIEADLPELPAAWAPLHGALQTYVQRQKIMFLSGLDQPGAREQAQQLPWDLDLGIGVGAQTDRLVSVQVDGSSFTGGAHPTPIVDSFTYDIQRRTVIGLDDLFSDPTAAETALAAEARRQLLTRLDDDAPLISDAETINDGTTPGEHHFDVFGLMTNGERKATGITLMFPPYQVAAYVAGTQTVDVPAHVFATWLKPEYRATFQP
jgi:hypothetical protein